MRPRSNKPFSRLVGTIDVFMDDFIQAGQGKTSKLRALRRHLLHSVDEVLSRPTTDEKRNEAISLKKLLTGDGSWGTRKLILGWIIDTAHQTLKLPPHRKQALHEIFSSLQGLWRVSAKKWRSILGKLWFVAQAIPGSAGLFSALQWAQNQAGQNRVRLNLYVWSNIDAFGRLAASLCSRPTHWTTRCQPLQPPHSLSGTCASRAQSTRRNGRGQGRHGRDLLRPHRTRPLLAERLPGQSPRRTGQNQQPGRTHHQQRLRAGGALGSSQRHGTQPP
jgi:hypothetical protein